LPSGYEEAAYKAAQSEDSHAPSNVETTAETHDSGSISHLNEACETSAPPPKSEGPEILENSGSEDQPEEVQTGVTNPEMEPDDWQPVVGKGKRLHKKMGQPVGRGSIPDSTQEEKVSPKTHANAKVEEKTGSTVDFVFKDTATTEKDTDNTYRRLDRFDTSSYSTLFVDRYIDWV